jgi:hypothetical protein
MPSKQISALTLRQVLPTFSVNISSSSFILVQGLRSFAALGDESKLIVNMRGARHNVIVLVEQQIAVFVDERQQAPAFGRRALDGHQ